YINEASKCTPFKIKIGEAKLLQSNWIDEDGYAYGNDTANYKITKAGLDQQVYAYAQLEEVANEKVTLEIWEQAYKQQVIKTIKEVAVNGKGVFKQAIALNTIKKMKDGSSLAFRIFNASGKEIQKVSSKYSSKLRISDTKQLLRAYYTTGGGSILTKFMHYDQQVTLEVVTSNMVGEELDIELYQLIDWSLLDWNGDTKAIEGTKQKITVNSNGKAELQFTIKKSWELAYAKDDKGYLEIIPKVNNQFYGGLSTNKNNYIYRLKVSPEAEKLNAEKSPQSCNLVQIEKVAGSRNKNKKKGRCNNCDKDITLEEIKNICADASGKCLIKDMTMISMALPYLNQYRKKVGIDTCTRKAHFLAQIAVESKFYDLQENFNWYWESLITTFVSYFKQFTTQSAKETEAKRLGREEKDGTALTLEEQKILANAIYGSTHPVGKGAGHKEGDGWLYSGKGFKQITWKSNYKTLQGRFNRKMKIDNEEDVNWVGGDNPYKLKNNAKDAMVSALAFWDWKFLNSRADIGDSLDAVTAVSKEVNASDDSIPDRYNFFQKAIETLNAKECVDYKRRDGQIGTVVVVDGKAHDKFDYKNKEGVVNLKDVVRYKTCVYRSMELDTYKKLKAEDNLPIPDYTTYLSRDAHGDKIKYGIHKANRYGKNNECPPGEYYLIPKAEKGKQSHSMYVSADGIQPTIPNGPGGYRDGIAIHNWNPTMTIGCLSTVQYSSELEDDLFGNIADLKIKNREVRII
ncbi:hypothetical protein J2Q02_13550, partial [Tenacibaculum finnmarkense genomovar finnmarkense]|uniref:glycoside hydrolase family 19 protein n=1 Tax=Tenacibaculum finnmarkense TaxID=2781243 RepID=UPI001EFB2AD8